MKLGWAPWTAVPIALALATLLALVLGSLSARSTGIYFLMLTLTYAVIGFYFFGQVTTFSGFGGMTGIDAPAFFLDQPKRLYYAALVLSVLAYAGFRAIARTPFGMALQGVRDDPIRMASLGFNVQLHRTLAFTLAGFVAGVAGVLNIWWNGQIDPTSIGIGPTLDLFIIAVIGGIMHLEGAWLGAFVFVGANIYLRDIPLDRSPRRSVRGPPAGRGTIQHRHRRAAPRDHAGLARRPRRHHRPSAQRAVSRSVGRGSTDGVDARRSIDANRRRPLRLGQPPVGP